jgi:hypothetical protein
MTIFFTSDTYIAPGESAYTPTVSPRRSKMPPAPTRFSRTPPAAPYWPRCEPATGSAATEVTRNFVAGRCFRS